MNALPPSLTGQEHRLDNNTAERETERAMILTMVDGPRPEAHPWLIVWCSGGVDKAQRRRWEGAIRRRSDERWQRSIARASGELDAARRCGGSDKRLRIAIIACSSEQGLDALDAQHPPNRQRTHGDA